MDALSDEMGWAQPPIFYLVLLLSTATTSFFVTSIIIVVVVKKCITSICPSIMYVVRSIDKLSSPISIRDFCLTLCCCGVRSLSFLRSPSFLGASYNRCSLFSCQNIVYGTRMDGWFTLGPQREEPSRISRNRQDEGDGGRSDRPQHHVNVYVTNFVSYCIRSIGRSIIRLRAI